MTQERNCENCAHYHMEAYEWPCNVCEASYDNPPTKWESDNKPQTNADHIREMTIAELADLLDAFGSCSRCRKNGNDCFPISNTVEWLQLPYKENEDE